MAEMITAVRIVSSSSQSRRGPSWSAYWRQPRKTAISASPIRSKPRSSEKSGLSMSIASHTTVATKRPGTTLTRNSQCQEKVSVRKPPTVGPIVPEMLNRNEIMTIKVTSCGPRNFA